MATRREIIAAAAATVTLPMLTSALGSMRRSQAAASAPSTAPTSAPARRGNSRTAPDEKAGWFATKIKPADVKADEFTDVPDHVIALSRTGNDIIAMTTKCTHQGCKVAVKAGDKIITCPCHMAKYNIDGTNASGPAKLPLSHYAIRVNADGFIEIDPGTKPKPEDKEAKVTAA